MKIATMMPEGSKASTGTAEVRGRYLAGGAKAVGAGNARDRVNLSADAVALAAAMRDLVDTGGAEDSGRLAHIEELKLAVAAGEYPVDVQALAAAIVDEAKGRSGGRGGPTGP
jgi:anti-sigma28 factor (negative regulator of flagellin synthesis)